MQKQGDRQNDYNRLVERLLMVVCDPVPVRRAPVTGPWSAPYKFVICFTSSQEYIIHTKLSAVHEKTGEHFKLICSPVLCLYVALTDIKPRIDLLVKNERAHATQKFIHQLLVVVFTVQVLTGFKICMRRRVLSSRVLFQINEDNDVWNVLS